MVRDLGVRLVQFPNFYDNFMVYVEAHISILETLEKLGICYRIILVVLLLVRLLVVD